MAIPSSVLAIGWIPFVVVLTLSLIFAFCYIRFYQHHELSEVSCTLISVVALFITFLTTILVPVDVFLASFMKSSDGFFKSWAQDPSARASMQETVTYAYYTLYGCIALFIFIILPFMYFFYEEKDDDETSSSRACTSLKYTAVFLLLALVVLVTGAFVPLRAPPSNVTSAGDKLSYLKEELKVYTHAEQCISVMVGVLSLFGITLLAFYTGYGLSALPLKMLSCCKGNTAEEEDGPVTNGLSRRERDETRARMLRAKANSGRNLTRWERNQLRRIEEDERLRRRNERRRRNAKNSICGKISLILAPFRALFGVLMLLLSLLIMTAIVITSIDKSRNSLGYKYGYALPKPTIFNPLNELMLFLQQVFPLDYLLYLGIVLFLFFATMTGLKRIGIWCCCVRMYKIRPQRTMPQALLLMIFMMMLIVVAINVLLFTMAPQYTSFGSQHFVGNTSSGLLKKQICSTESPPDECEMTRMAVLLNKLFYKAWFFGVYYYYAQWCLIGVFVIGFIVSLIKCKEPDYDEADPEDSDEEQLITA
ncbi:probable lysosomal cobalamin transporter [Rhopilema esculentum]|uniref:probable lysosomal cobalamin transporter n=1 Tax=Rhopilema esculentum TaxID=499914 RepID=UPI0031CDF7F1